MSTDEQDLNQWKKPSHIDGSVQRRCNSSALAMELCFSCTNLLLCDISHWLRSCTAIDRKCVHVRMITIVDVTLIMKVNEPVKIFMVSCQKGPTYHAYAWQIGPFWQDTLDIRWMWLIFTGHDINQNVALCLSQPVIPHGNYDVSVMQQSYCDHLVLSASMAAVVFLL